MLEQTQFEWDCYYLDLARTASKKSKDPSTKVGAFIVRPDKTAASFGFNGFPKKMADRIEWYADRAEKLKRAIHAEINALHWRKEPVTGCTLYVWPFMPCDRCAIDVIQAGIVRVVAPKTSENVLARWADSVDRAADYFRTCGVVMEFVEFPVTYGVDL